MYWWVYFFLRCLASWIFFCFEFAETELLNISLKPAMVIHSRLWLFIVELLVWSSCVEYWLIHWSVMELILGIALQQQPPCLLLWIFRVEKALAVCESWECFFRFTYYFRNHRISWWSESGPSVMLVTPFEIMLRLLSGNLHSDLYPKIRLIFNLNMQILNLSWWLMICQVLLIAVSVMGLFFCLKRPDWSAALVT